VKPPTSATVAAARICVDGYAVRTPLLENPQLNHRLGFRLLLKAECLQRTGSFKFRGAMNAVSLLTAAQREAGVVAYSSGNHAQGVAAAAAIFGIPALIVMPADAPAIKLAGTRAYGAEIVTYDRWREQREDVAAAIAARRGAAILPPFDHPDIIAGQGTVGLETIEQADAAGVTLDCFVTNASGGGLTAGCALAFEAGSPATRLYCAEPTDFDDHARSLAAGSRQANVGKSPSICDALMAPMPGEITFPINQPRLAGALTASDDEIADAMLVAFRDFKVVVEPGGAAGLAAVLAGRLPGRPSAVAVVASGGNVDPATFRRLLQEAELRAH
jgi:threonine dehydratase